MRIDIAKPGVDAIATCFLFTVEEGPVAGSVFAFRGATAVQRGAAQFDPETRKFRIPTTMLNADHQGVVDALGGNVTLSLQEGTTPTGTIEGTLDANHALVGTAHSTFQGVALRIDSPQGSFDVDPADVSADITAIPPAEGTQYSHPVPLAIRKGQIVILKGRAVHRIGGCPPPPDTRKNECCCKPPCCSVEAHGHCTCFRVGSAHPEQLLFVASHPGVTASPLGQDRVLVYKTITNLGPEPVEIYWDGAPPAYMVPAQMAPLAPGNSLTVAAGRAVKVKYAGAAGGEARGFDVISWCCPPFGTNVGK